MKPCITCGATLALSEFYQHPKTSDGHVNQCKRCTRLAVRANRAVNRAHYREYERARTRDPKRRADIFAAARKDPLKRKARLAVQNAVRRGTIVRQPCEVCGEAKTDAHHEDYTQPFQVRWLCRRHHVDQHFPAFD